MNGVHGFEHLQALVFNENTEVAQVIVDRSNLHLVFPDRAQHGQLGLAKGTGDHPDAFEYTGADPFQFRRLEIHQGALDQRIVGGFGQGVHWLQLVQNARVRLMCANNNENYYYLQMIIVIGQKVHHSPPGDVFKPEQVFAFVSRQNK